MEQTTYKPHKRTEMKWISINDQTPPTNETIFICGVEKQGRKVNLYYAEADFDGNKFDHPYYGQELTGSFKNVTHWCKPEPPTD